MKPHSPHGPGWRPSARLFWGLFAVCTLLAIAGFFVESEHRFAWQFIPAFYVLFGFGAFLMIVQISKLLRKLLMRREGYYDR